jgi:hypothetical protein
VARHVAMPQVVSSIRTGDDRWLGVAAAARRAREKAENPEGFRIRNNSANRTFYARRMAKRRSPGEHAP